MSSYAKQVDFLQVPQINPDNSDVYSNGYVKVLLSGTSTLATVYSARDKGGTFTNPFALDADGTKEIYLDGIFDIELWEGNPSSGGVKKDTISGLDYRSAYGESVTNLTALKAITGSTGETVFMEGYTDAGDGGGGWFYWDSSDLSAEVAVDPQEGVYAPPNSDSTGASGAWVRQFNGAVNVDWFGAGSGDPTQPIQEALDYVTDTGQGRVTIDGIYEITSPIVLTKLNNSDHNSVVIDGSGTIKKATSFTGDRLITIAVDYFDEDNIIFRGLTFDGVDDTINGVDWFDDSEVYTSNPTTRANTTYAKAVRFESCNFNNFYRGARISGNSNTFLACTFRSNVCGAYNVAGGNDIRFIACNFRNNNYGAHVRVSSATLGTLDTQFTNCIFESNQNAGVALDGEPTGVTFVGGYYENNGFNVASTNYASSLTGPTEACHVFSTGSTGAPIWAFYSNVFTNSPAGVSSIYGPRIRNLEVYNSRLLKIKPTSLFNKAIISGPFSYDAPDVFDLSAFSTTEGEIYAVINGQKYYAEAGSLLPLDWFDSGLVNISDTKTIVTTTNIRYMYEVWVENASNGAAKFIAHRGSSSVVKVAELGSAVDVATLVWSGDDLQLTAGAATANRYQIKQMILR